MRSSGDDPYNACLRSYSSLDWEVGTGPLSHLQYVIKDNISIAGYPTSWGLEPAAVESAADTAAIVSELTQQGASLLGATNLDPCALSCTGDNPYYGKVLNPTDAELIAGGSSSGCAAAVAAGLADFAVGTDMGGSIRLPAAACGLFGLKCSPKAKWKAGVLGLDSLLDTVGFLARECNVLLEVCSALSFEPSNVSGAVCFVVPCESLDLLDPESKQAFELACEGIAGRHEVRWETGEFGFKASVEIYKHLVAASFVRLIDGLPNAPQLPDVARVVYALGKSLSTEQERDYTSQAERLSLEARRILSDGLSCILLPTLPGSIPSWGELKNSASESLNHLLLLANIIGFPAISCPAHSPNLPGLQLIGPPQSELGLLRIAELLESTQQ